MATTPTMMILPIDELLGSRYILKHVQSQVYIYHLLQTLDHMGAERLGHGYHAYDDDTTYRRVLREQIHPETCPISSIYLSSFTGIRSHGC